MRGRSGVGGRPAPKLRELALEPLDLTLGAYDLARVPLVLLGRYLAPFLANAMHGVAKRLSGAVGALPAAKHLETQASLVERALRDAARTVELLLQTSPDRHEMGRAYATAASTAAVGG
jgi:hypothetical protein